MPTYEYECDACAHRFELLQSMSEPAVRKCPKCKRLKVRRLISGGAGFIFKGSGFYETDYKRNRTSADASKRAADAAPGSGDGAKSGAADGSAGSSAAGAAPDAAPATSSAASSAKPRAGKADRPAPGSSGAAKKRGD